MNDRHITASLRALLLDASELLDPQHQRVIWPDPVEWDGRPLREQARDILVLLDSRAEAGDDDAAELAAALRAALEADLRALIDRLRSLDTAAPTSHGGAR